MRISFKLLIIIGLFGFLLENAKAFSQNKNVGFCDIYKLNYWVETPATFGLFAMNMWGYDRMKDKPKLSIEKINSLNIDNIWWIDRSAPKQYASYRHTAHDISDWGMNVALVIPAFLALDKEIRYEWLDVLLLYMEAHAINSFIYAWGVSSWSERIRPFVYNPDVTLADKMESGTTDSFYSGHTSTTATTSFFMAKVYDDFHPGLGNKRWWLYTAALVPPAFVGYYRYKALKHYPTDIIAGTIIGGLCGYFVPHLHKRMKSDKLSITPFSGELSGLTVRIKF